MLQKNVTTTSTAQKLPPPNQQDVSILQLFLQHFGPTMDGSDLDEAGIYGRSKRYLITDPDQPEFDELFPDHFKVSGSERAPRIWWTHEIAAWMEKKEAIYKSGKSDHDSDRSDNAAIQHARAPRKISSIAVSRRVRVAKTNV